MKHEFANIKDGFQCDIIICLIFITICISSAEIHTQTHNSKSYTVGYSKNLLRGFNLNDARVAAGLMENALIKESNRGGVNNSLIIEEPDQVEDFIVSKHLDFVSLTTLEYFLCKQKVNLHPYCAAIARDSILNRLILLVRNDSNINSIQDLKGKTLSLTSGYDENYKFTTAWMKVLFWKNQVKDIKKFLGKIKSGDNPSIIASYVFFNNTDACILQESEYEALKELNPQLGKKLKVLIKSEHILTELGLYTDNVKNDPDLNSIIDLTYKLDTFAAGRNLLRLLKVKKMIVLKPEYFVTAENLYKDFIRLGRTCK